MNGGLGLEFKVLEFKVLEFLIRAPAPTPRSPLYRSGDARNQALLGWERLTRGGRQMAKAARRPGPRSLRGTAARPTVKGAAPIGQGKLDPA